MKLENKKDKDSSIFSIIDSSLGKPKKKEKKREEKRKKERVDPKIYYYKDNKIITSTLFTEDIDSFLEWVVFICPPLISDSEFKKSLVEDEGLRKDFFKNAYLDGLSIYYTLFRCHVDMLMNPNNFLH